jgi:hypothetical protein
MSNNKKKDRGPADPPPAANPEPCQALSLPTLVRIIFCLAKGDDNILFDTLCACVVCGVTAEECMAAFQRWARAAPHLAAGFRDDSARRARGLRLLVEEALAPLVTQTACVLTGDGPERTVHLDVDRSPELLVAQTEVHADYGFGVAGARQAGDAWALSDDEVRLRAAAALRFAKDPMVRRLLADAALEDVRRQGRVPPPPVGSTPSSGPDR